MAFDLRSGLEPELVDDGPVTGVAPGKRTLTQGFVRGGGANPDLDTAHPLLGERSTATTGRTAFEDPFALHLGRPMAAAQSVQADGDLEGPRVHAVAARGVSGNGGVLPHASLIQSSFGHHDVSGVRAHIGGEAATASGQLGARAYASGDDVAFAAAPDLRLAAHEAAHIVQQRGGVRLDDGVGRKGDRYEHHADVVADLVVRGESAEAALDTMAHRGGGGGPAVQRYTGEHESLSTGATHAMGDDELRESSAGTLATLAGGPDEGALGNRELVRFEMARRGLDQAPPAAPAQQIVVDGIVWGDDATYVRWVLEQLLAGQMGRTAEEAHAQVVRHLRQVRERAGFSPVAGVPLSVPPDVQANIDLIEAVLHRIETQLPQIQLELLAFITEFESGARQLGLEILAESETRITDELARYGLTRETVMVTRSDYDGLAHSTYQDFETHYNFNNSPAATQQRTEMMAAARAIAASERRVQTLRQRRAMVAERLRSAEACAAPAASDPTQWEDLDADVDEGGAGPTLYDVCQAEPPDLVGSAPQLRDLLGSLDRGLAHTEEEHQLLRAEKEGAFPVIATYTSGETIDLAGLDRLASAPSAAAIGQDAYEKLDNIRRVREELGDGLSIYELPQLLELAKSRYTVAPNSPRAAAIQHQAAEHASGSMWRSIGIMVLSIGLGLLAAIPTGGASLAVTGTVLAAEVAGLTLDAYLLYQSVQEYEVRGALTNTDFDRARVLSHDEPSLFWLAVDILGTGIGLAGALHTFSQVARVRRAVIAARNIDEAAEQLGELRRLREAGRISAEAATRIEREILRDLPDQAIAQALGRAAGDAARPAAEVATAMGRQLGDVVGADDIARLSDELGLPVVQHADLGDEVRVMFEVVDGRVARARSIAIGSGATVGDVLGHRETVTLLRRMETATAALGRNFDELIGTVVDASGRVNPFPAGSQAFNSWMELRKYPEMIQQRLARLGEDGVARSERELLREQVSFFETEMAHHRDVVQRAVLERGEDFIARAARSNDAAFAAGYPREVTLPDGRRFPIGQAGSQFYYAIDNSTGTQRYILRRYVDAVDAPALTLTRGANGLWEVVEGGLSRTEAAEALVRGWSDIEQQAFRNARTAAEAAHPGARVVPLAGIHHTGVTIGSLLDADVTTRLREALVEALSRTHPPREAQRLAREALGRLSSHPIVVVRGTDQLRAFGYRRSFMSATGEVIEGDLHHWIPLYLGGDHRIHNLFDLDPSAHRSIHEALEGVEFSTATLDPNQIGRLDLDFEHGLGILMPDGSIKLESLAAYSVSSAP